MARFDIAARRAGTAAFPSAQNAHANWLDHSVRGEMPEGAVIYHSPSERFQAPGGGEVQLVETARAVEALGLRVRPFVPWIDRVEHARLVHLFGMSREGLALARIAKARGVPVVLSPICWFEPRGFRATSVGRLDEARAWGAWLTRRAVPALPHWRRALLRIADRILPNSARERDQLIRLFAIDPARFRVVPNGVSPRFARGDRALFTRRTGLSDCVLYVGRIEPRKNVLMLIEALRGTGLPLVVIGDAVPGHELYHARCRGAGAGCARWLGGMRHDDPLLPAAFAAARVLALPSWFETPGLAALEGALAGCGVAVTPYGCTYEYFGELAQYADPRSESRIARAVMRAWDRSAQPELAGHVASRFLWPRVAERTVEVYDELAR